MIKSCDIESQKWISVIKFHQNHGELTFSMVFIDFWFNRYLKIENPCTHDPIFIDLIRYINTFGYWKRLSLQLYNTINYIQKQNERLTLCNKLQKQWTNFELLFGSRRASTEEIWQADSVVYSKFLTLHNKL